MNWIVNDDTKLSVAAPKYPLGGYIEGYSLTSAVVVPIINAMAAAKFDHVFMPISGFGSQATQDAAIIAAVEDNGMKILLESNDPNGANPDSSPEDFAGFTSIFAAHGDDWCAGIQCYDDMETHANASTRYAALAAAFPHLPIYGSGESITAGTNLTRRQQCDIMAQQNYPVGQENIIPACVRRYEGARTSGKPLIGNGQYFAWSGEALPTDNQVEAMGFIAVMYCEALTWYTMYNASIYGNAIDVVNTPAIFDAMKSVNNWVRKYETYLLEGTKEITTSGSEGSETGVSCTWTLDGQEVTLSVDKYVVEGFDIEK